MRLSTPAILLAVRARGEHGAVVRALTPDDGVQPGYVRGGRSRRLRPVLMPGNLIQADYRAHTDAQLAQLSVELIHSRAPLLAEPLPAAAIEWATVLTATALPEAQPYRRVHDGLEGLLNAVEAAPSALGWAAALVRYELLLLGELGFGLDLSACAATGATEALAFVSPKSGRAVSVAGAAGLEDRLLRLPPFVRAGGPATWREIADGLALARHFLARDLLIERQAEVLAARERLTERLARVTR